MVLGVVKLHDLPRYDRLKLPITIRQIWESEYASTRNRRAQTTPHSRGRDPIDGCLHFNLTLVVSSFLCYESARGQARREVVFIRKIYPLLLLGRLRPQIALFQ